MTLAVAHRAENNIVPRLTAVVVVDQRVTGPGNSVREGPAAVVAPAPTSLKQGTREAHPRLGLPLSSLTPHLEDTPLVGKAQPLTLLRSPHTVFALRSQPTCPGATLAKAVSRQNLFAPAASLEAPISQLAAVPYHPIPP